MYLPKSNRIAFLISISPTVTEKKWHSDYEHARGPELTFLHSYCTVTWGGGVGVCLLFLRCNFLSKRQIKINFQYFYYLQSDGNT